MAYEQKMYNETIKTLLLVVVGLPLIVSTNIDCRGQSFHCVNATHFMICVDVGGGLSTTVDDFTIACPPPTQCRPHNRFECELPPPPTPLPTTPLPTPTEQLLVNPITNRAVEEHMELSTLNTTQDPVTDPKVIPLQSGLVNETTTAVSEKDAAQLKPTATADPLNITTFVSKQSASENVTSSVWEHVTPTSAIPTNQTYDDVTETINITIDINPTEKLTETLDSFNENNSEGISKIDKTERNSLTRETTVSFENVRRRTAIESAQPDGKLANINTVNTLLEYNHTKTNIIANNSDSRIGGVVTETSGTVMIAEETARHNKTLANSDSAVYNDESTDASNKSTKTSDIDDSKFILEPAVILQNVINVTAPEEVVTGSTQIDTTLSIVGTELYQNKMLTGNNAAGITDFVGDTKTEIDDFKAEVVQSGLTFSLKPYVTTESTAVSLNATELLTTYDTTTKTTATTKATTNLVKSPTVMDSAATTTVENIEFQSTAVSTDPVAATLNIYHQQLDEIVANNTGMQQKYFIPVASSSRNDTRQEGKLENFLGISLNKAQNTSGTLPLQKQLSERAITSLLDSSTDPVTQRVNTNISKVHHTSSDLLQNPVIITVKTKSTADFNAYHTQNKEANIGLTDTTVKLTSTNNGVTSSIMDTDKESNFNAVENELSEKQFKDTATTSVTTQTSEAIFTSRLPFSKKTEFIEILNTTNTHTLEKIQFTTNEATKMRENNIVENITLNDNIHYKDSHKAVLDLHISDSPQVTFKIITESVTTAPVASRPVQPPTTDADIIEVTSAKTASEIEHYTQGGEDSSDIIIKEEADAIPATLRQTVEYPLLNGLKQSKNQTVISNNTIPYTKFPSVENKKNKPLNVDTDQETLYKLKKTNILQCADSLDLKGKLDLIKQDSHNDSLTNIIADTSTTNKPINKESLHSPELAMELRLSEVDSEYVNKTTTNISSNYSVNIEKTVQIISNQFVSIGLRTNITNKLTETDKPTTEDNSYETKTNSLNKNVTIERFEETANLPKSPFQERTDKNIDVSEINTINFTSHRNDTILKHENITVENKTLTLINSTNANISKEYRPSVSERKSINEMELLLVTQSKAVVNSLANKTLSTENHSFITPIAMETSGVEKQDNKTIIDNLLSNSEKAVHNPVENMLFNGTNNFGEESILPALPGEFKNKESSNIVAVVTNGVVNIFDDHSSGTTDSAATSYFASESSKWRKILETDTLVPFKNNDVSNISQNTDNNINNITNLTPDIKRVQSSTQDTSSASTILRSENKSLVLDQDATKQPKNFTFTESFNFNITQEPKYSETMENLEFVSSYFNRSGLVMNLPLESNSEGKTPGISLSQSTLQDIIKETLAEDENTDVILETFISFNVTTTPSIYERESNGSYKTIFAGSWLNEETTAKISTNSAPHKKTVSQILMEPENSTETSLPRNVLSPTEQTPIISVHSIGTLYSSLHATSGRGPDPTFHEQIALEQNADTVHTVQQKTSERPLSKSSARTNTTVKFYVDVSARTLLTTVDSTLSNPESEISEPNSVTEATTTKIKIETSISTSPSTEVSVSASVSNVPPSITTDLADTATTVTATKDATTSILTGSVTVRTAAVDTATPSTHTSGIAAPDCSLCSAVTTSDTVTSSADTLGSSSPGTYATGNLISDNATSGTTTSDSTTSSPSTYTALRGPSTPSSTFGSTSKDTAAFGTATSDSAISSLRGNIMILTDSAVPGTALLYSNSDSIASINTTAGTVTLGADIASETPFGKVITVTDSEKSDAATSVIALGSAAIGIDPNASYGDAASSSSATVMSSPGTFTSEISAPGSTSGSGKKDIATSGTGMLGNTTETTASGSISDNTASGRATTDTTASKTSSGIAVTSGSYVSGSTARSVATEIAASHTASSDASILSNALSTLSGIATLDSSFQNNLSDGTTGSFIIPRDTASGIATSGSTSGTITSGTASSGAAALSRISETIASGSTRGSAIRGTAVTDTATSGTAILGTFLSSSSPGDVTMGKGTISALTDIETLNNNKSGVEISDSGLSGTTSGSVAIGTAATDTITVGIVTSGTSPSGNNSDSTTKSDTYEYTLGITSSGTATTGTASTSTGASSSSISYGITGSALKRLAAAEIAASGTSGSGIVILGGTSNTTRSSNNTKSAASEIYKSGTAILDNTTSGISSSSTSTLGSIPVILSSGSNASSAAKETATVDITTSSSTTSQCGITGIAIPETALISAAIIETESLGKASAGTLTPGTTISSATIGTDSTDMASFGRTTISDTPETAIPGTTTSGTTILGTNTSATTTTGSSSFSTPISHRTTETKSTGTPETKGTATKGTAATSTGTVGIKSITSTRIATSTGIVETKGIASLTGIATNGNAISTDTATSLGTVMKGALIPGIATTKSSTTETASKISAILTRSAAIGRTTIGTVTTGTATPTATATKTTHSASSTATTVTTTSGAAPPGGPSGSARSPAAGWSCLGLPTGRYADEDDCRKFYLCVGVPRALAGLCPNNTVFSDIRKQCTRNLSHCVRRNQFKCVSAGRFSDFVQPNVYYICVKKGGVFYRYKLQCQKGYHLDKSVHCVTIPEQRNSAAGSPSASGDSSLSAAADRGPGVPGRSHSQPPTAKRKSFECDDEGNFADPYDCRGYFVCQRIDSSEEKYYRKHKTCDEDEVFDRKKKKCVDASSNECSYCDRTNTNVYYVKAKRRGYLFKFKLQCRSGYSLDKSTVKCYKGSSCEGPCRSQRVGEGEGGRWSGVCGAEGRFPDPRDPRRYYECRRRARGRTKHRTTYKQKHRKCNKHEVFSAHKRRCVHAHAEDAGSAGSGDH